MYCCCTGVNADAITTRAQAASQDGQGRKKAATGVVAHCVGVEPPSAALKLRFKSRLVVASAGALHNPPLLLRSGIKANVGKDFKCHPAMTVFGIMSSKVRRLVFPTSCILQMTSAAACECVQHCLILMCLPNCQANKVSAPSCSAMRCQGF